MNKITYRYINWDYIDHLTGNLCHDIIKSKIKIDIILAIARGGLIPARLISEGIDVKNIMCATVSFYNENNKRKNKPIMKYGFTSNTVYHLASKHVLIVDDICDTGKTFEVIKNSYGNLPFGVHTASIFYKEKSKVKPDFFCETVPNNTWVIFPWEKK